MFQRLEITDENASIYERSNPVHVKHSEIRVSKYSITMEIIGSKWVQILTVKIRNPCSHNQDSFVSIVTKTQYSYAILVE